MDLTNPLHLASVVIGCSLAGMLSHYVKKWLRKEIDGSLVDYLFRDDPRRTTLAILTCIGAGLTGVLQGVFAGMTLSQVILLAFSGGYTIDSSVNKGAAPTPPA
jgi:hypothetical protein